MFATTRTIAEAPEKFDRIRFLDMLIAVSRRARGACLWCGEQLTKDDTRFDLCNACQAQMEATR